MDENKKMMLSWESQSKRKKQRFYDAVYKWSGNYCHFSETPESNPEFFTKFDDLINKIAELNKDIADRIMAVQKRRQRNNVNNRDRIYYAHQEPPPLSIPEECLNRARSLFDIPEIEVARHLSLVWHRCYNGINTKDVMTCHQHHHYQLTEHFEVRNWTRA